MPCDCRDLLALRFDHLDRMRRLSQLIRHEGWLAACGTVASIIEDEYLRLFDRVHGVHTSGHIPLTSTSLEDPKSLTFCRYRPVNAWALRKFLRQLELNPSGNFVDLGCGFGRACLVAADFGFSKVTGVELVPEFCIQARENVARWQGSLREGAIEIIKADAVSYAASAEHDFYFMFRPFSGPIFEQVLDNIEAAAARSKRLTRLVYSERVMQTNSNEPALRRQSHLVLEAEWCGWGQRFWAFRVMI